MDEEEILEEETQDEPVTTSGKTLGDMKKRVLSLIEEINPQSQYLTDDEDIRAKINYVIDEKQHELARIKKIAAQTTLSCEVDTTYDLYEEIEDLYQLKSMRGIEYERFDNFVKSLEDGVLEINYYKYPEMITTDTPDSHELEISTDAFEIMPFGVAADLLKSDVSSQYGQVYANAYREALNMLDVKFNSNNVTIKNGIRL